MNELEDYVRIRRPVYEDMLITLDYQTQEIEKLKSLIDNYEEEHKLWQDTIKSVELLKANGLPDDTQFILMTKEDYERNQEQYDKLVNFKLEEKENTINVPNYYKLKLENIKEWLEEEITNFEDECTYIFKDGLGKTIRVNDMIIEVLYEVLERLG